MEELKSVLREQARRYPAMEPTDAVKLVYQNEFGGAHLIRDEQECLNYLRREYAATTKDPALPLTEALGNGILRVYLAALTEGELDRLGRAFLRSAAAHIGSLPRFEQKLEILKELTQQGVFAFSPEALEEYLRDYRQAGYPPVSHSEQYRRAYAPAYRVVRREFF